MSGTVQSVVPEAKQARLLIQVDDVPAALADEYPRRPRQATTRRVARRRAPGSSRDTRAFADSSSGSASGPARVDGTRMVRLGRRRDLPVSLFEPSSLRQERFPVSHGYRNPGAPPGAPVSRPVGPARWRWPARPASSGLRGHCLTVRRHGSRNAALARGANGGVCRSGDRSSRGALALGVA